MPPVRMRWDGRKAKNPKKTLSRLLSYMKQYRTTMIVVIVCILLSAVAQVAASKSLQYVVDDYITPMLGVSSPDFGPLIRFLCLMACVYVVGMVSSFLYNFLMVKVGQGTQKSIRDAMFTHMQRLPIRYFDTHPVGDTMSRYTSDIDTLRQMISQAIPQCISSIATIVVVFLAMVVTSPLLTLAVLATVSVILVVTKVIAGKSARFFVAQQQALGAANGYVEEMINGQRVVKVFCHEEAANREFDGLNDTLRVNAFKAGAYSNMMGPINNNLGYIQYAILAILGGFIVISSHEKLLTTGALMSFMLLSRSFNMPIGQVSNQINAIVMALACGRHHYRMPGAHLPLGLEAPPRRRHPDLYPPAGRHYHGPCGLRLHPGQGGPSRCDPLRQARPEAGLRGRHRRRQNHHYEPSQPVL